MSPRMKTLLGLLGLCIQQAVSEPISDASTSYDYVIVGGGTAGLALANRLTENPAVSVAVVEPGTDQRQNPLVTDPSAFTLAFGTTVDWNYTTVNQTYNNVSRRLTIEAGRALGGSSTINGMTYVRAQKVQIDAWEGIGNPGWNWASLFPYYLKSEGFQTPTPAQTSDGGATFDPKYHNTKGPVGVGWQFLLRNGSMHSIHNETWQHLGYQFNPDVNGGNELGFNVWPRTINRTTNTREDAASAYLWPYKNQRPNLHIIQGFVNKITWARHKTGSNAVASGVQYTASNGQAANLAARKEVILSAGAIRSPALLELSGVGNPAILSNYGIQVVVNNTGVGEHLQDQPNSGVYYTSPNGTSQNLMPYVTYASARDVYGNRTSAVSAKVKSSIPTWAKEASDRSNGAISTAAYKKILLQQWDLIFNQDIPAGELLNSQTEGLLLGVLWNLITFSRGNVHIGSADATANPLINLNYFWAQHDLDFQVELAKIQRKFYHTQPVESLVQTELQPGFATVPDGATDAQWADWIQSSFNSNWHPVGTAAMLPRELGGVVDSRLVVYGTSNVRVVDASAFPMQVSGHLSATVYALAERAADIIKGVV